ncbi:hypothetical protein K504DRAFT_413426 [Pleomassaria siparia CBS 279.74]|uniref:Uncharacterized protein n=1 Tax=Pleomassaria siparia CBS 279.74 TaxID=1314801 RepID=A0A6G1K0Q8_9PLEO|nr:hypothetical protein K504DRAFT_413426 [Pleomassaria siparia CBS 279.74]
MAGGLEVMPMSPGPSPKELGNAVLLWIRSRRGRVLAMGAVFMLFVLGLMGMRHSDTISTNYHLPSWRPHLPNMPSIITSPLQPSNQSLELENGDAKTVPSNLHKATPNFHLLMSALEDNAEFCKTTLSAMLLNYPPPTILVLRQEFKSRFETEKAKLASILGYLENAKMVNDDDLLLIVDGMETWFQLPSDVMIRQYQNVLADANKRLADRYGRNRDGTQRFSQTIVFGAEKACEGEDLACRYAPDSILPENIYGKHTGKEKILTPAKYLNSNMLIGPAKDLKPLFKVALSKFVAENSQAGTSQSVFATMFGEQQLARDAKPKKTTAAKWVDWFGGQAAEPVTDQSANLTLQEGLQYDFSMGLDYTHELFQPFVYAAEDELVPLPHDESIDLSAYHHADTPTPLLHVPTALEQAKLPFWAPDLSQNRPDGVKPSFIDKLAFDPQLDSSQPRDTTWTQLKLIQNTYTGAIPAAMHTSRPPKTNLKVDVPRAANLTWSSNWYAGHERALLRAYLRLPQSPIGYHDAVIGGDRLWDSRGGRGGVWTQKEAIWLPWGEVDGVCGTLDLLSKTFTDGKGVWLHETDVDAEGRRLADEDTFRKTEMLRKMTKAEREEYKKLEKEKERKKQDKANKQIMEKQKLAQEAEQAKKTEKEGEERKKQETATETAAKTPKRRRAIWIR